MPGRNRLAAVPDTTPRALALVRVSKERDGMISPDIQRAAITDYARTRGYQITGWLEGLDESGSRARSAWWPRLDQAVTAVENREYDVILVWKFSRTARHRLRWATALDRVEVAGGRLESATEQVDVTTSTGRFTRGMLAELGSFEAERTGEIWQEVHDRRVAAGKPASGKARYGYVNDPVEKVHKPDPVTGPVLASMYRRYVAGESMYALVGWLNDNGHRTNTGGLWSMRSLRRTMDTGFAAGFFSHKGVLHRGVHEPLIDQELWQAYLDARARRRAVPSRTERSQYLLSGLVRCARCGGPMNVLKAPHKPGQAPRMVCKRRNEYGARACGGTSVTMSFVEDAVQAWVGEQAAAVDGSAGAVDLLEVRRTTVAADLARVTREAARVEESLTRLSVQNATDPLPEVVYERARRELQEQWVRLSGRVDELQREARAASTDVAEVAAGLMSEWDELIVPLRRELLRRLVSVVLVRGGLDGGARRRPWVRVVPVWEARG